MDYERLQQLTAEARNAPEEKIEISSTELVELVTDVRKLVGLASSGIGLAEQTSNGHIGWVADAKEIVARYSLAAEDVFAVK